MKSRLALIASVISAGVVLAEPSPAMVELEVHFVKALPKQIPDELTSVVREGAKAMGLNGVFSEGTAENLLLELKKAGAETLSVPRAITIGGQPVDVRNVREIRYPIEYSEPNPATGIATPTKFAKKGVGISVNFIPMINDSELIELAMAFCIVKLNGFVDPAKLALGSDLRNPEGVQKLSAEQSAKNGIWQPIFHQQDVATTVHLNSGQTCLLSEVGGSPDEVRNLIFISVRILK